MSFIYVLPRWEGSSHDVHVLRDAMIRSDGLKVPQDMACDPSWKTDGGFKRNYMAEVHKRMLSKIPNLTKQVTPHLESKIKWLKTIFHIINDSIGKVDVNGMMWIEK
ncbi:hypothetical protein ZIOFF_048107 [Zingiber officinale]|uniref:DDE Tnp4 domain-containing protein n=1 Tax=Zingiber officinale TaxID=94328 RepID=A0A8J5KU54_ZINOF|nr:hypothetical protein ZIOFF_048107 [Zingiber officinale]